MPSRAVQLIVLVLTAAEFRPLCALDAAPATNSPNPTQREETKPGALIQGLRSAVLPPLKMFAQAPPITRSWVSASVILAILTSNRVVDARAICFSEPMVLHHGEWWRIIANFFYMGDQFKSIFFWMSLHHFWECAKILELVKYRWEPADFIKLILTNAIFLLCLKQLFPSIIFLGTPMAMVFLYMYSREYESQVMNLLGFFSIKCGWLPFAQMLQDLLQAGDIGPNMLGLMSGHTYYFLSEVRPRMVLPDTVGLHDVLQLVTHGKAIIADDEPPVDGAEPSTVTVDGIGDEDGAEADKDSEAVDGQAAMEGDKADEDVDASTSDK